MDTEEDKKEEIETFTEALATTPPAVRAFLWSKTYSGIIDGLAKYFALSADQKVVLETIVFDSIIGTMEEDDAEEKLSSLSLGPEKESLLLSFIYDYLIDRAASEAEITLDETGDAPAISAPSPLDILESLKTKLVQHTAVAPNITTSPTVNTNNAIINKVPEIPATPHTDPYRELPE